MKNDYIKLVLILIIVAIVAIPAGIWLSGVFNEDSSYNAIPVNQVQQSTNKESELLRALGLEPENSALYAKLGDVYFEKRDYIKSIDYYLNAIKFDPADVDSYNDLGLSYQYTGRSEDAISVLRKGIEIEPAYQRVWLSLGFVLATSNRTEEAKEAFKEVIQLNPLSPVGLEAARLLESL